MSNLQKVLEQLGQLLDIEDGWFDGEGKALSCKLISVIEGICRDLDGSDLLGTPVFGSRVDGGIEVEWRALGGRDYFYLSLECYPQPNYDYGESYSLCWGDEPGKLKSALFGGQDPEAVTEVLGLLIHKHRKQLL